MKRFELSPSSERMDWGLVPLHRDIKNLFDRFFDHGQYAQQDIDWMPAIDISETEKAIVIMAEMPGMETKDIDISLNGNVLTLKGKRMQEKEEKEENFHRVERSYGSFQRSLQLPCEVDDKKIDATYKKGILKIALPKKEVTSTKKIEIKS